MVRFAVRVWRWLRAEIVFGFLIATAFWAAILGWQAANAPTDAEKQKCHDAAERTGHKAEECKSIWERTTSDPVAFFTFWLVISTVGLGASTLLLWFAGERQLRHARRTAAIQSRDMRDSIEAAKEANRLNREIFAASRRPSLEVKVALAGDFHCDGKYGAVQLQITAQNVGAVPAINTVCRIMTFPNMYPVNETEQYRLLSESMKSSGRASGGFGDIIFPERGVEFSKPSTMATWFQQNIDIGKAKGAASVLDSLGVCICVD